MQAFISEVVPVGSVDFDKGLYFKIYFAGCDFRCLYCNTPEWIETKFEHERDLSELKKEIMNNTSNVEGVLVTGGEPCFQKLALIDILKFCKEIKLRTILDTNGSKPLVLKKLFEEKLVDKIIMDLKAPFTETFEKTTKSQTFFKQSKDVMDDLKKSLELIRTYDEDVEVVFRTIITPGLIFRKEEILSIAKEIETINCVWELMPFSAAIILDKKMKNINSPTLAFLESLRDSCLKKIPNLNIKINY
ncbi:MAG: radical SAM protein [Nanoarchaeota archaeon]|nr:radical SAM protein [Nanoarchaeota archaeon]